LAEITATGELTIVNCGHHPPLLRHGDDLRPLADGNAALPLGLGDDFTAFAATWVPGDRLLFYTDGLVDSRDRHGDFLPADAIRATPGTGREPPSGKPRPEHRWPRLPAPGPGTPRHHPCTATPAGAPTMTSRSCSWNTAHLRGAAPMDTQPPSPALPCPEGHT